MNVDILKARIRDIDGMSAAIANFECDHVTRSDRINGRYWYPNAYWSARILSAQYMPYDAFYKVCGVISAISPAVSWEINLQDAESLLQAYAETGDLSDVTVSTYGQNRDKAQRILDGGTTFASVNEHFRPETKTGSFFRAIAEPIQYADDVVIDRHTVGVALQSYGQDHMEFQITQRRYRDVQAAYIKAKDALGYANGSDLQAAVWIAYRREFGGRQFDVTEATKESTQSAPF